MGYKNDFDQFENDRMIEDPANYKWGLFYFNRADKRIIVPKRLKMMGWTLNFANFYTYVILLLIIAVAIIVGQLDR